jgi:hypothetical protein
MQFGKRDDQRTLTLGENRRVKRGNEKCRKGYYPIV